jgi:hypothetical protein
MASYSLGQRCKPRGDFRVAEIIDFLTLMKAAFRFSVLYDKRNKPVNLIPSDLHKIFQQKIDKIFPSIGVNVDFFSIPPRMRDRNTVRFEIHTGTHPDEIFIDFYNISIGEERKVPDLSYFEKSIEILKPFEAFLSEFDNEDALDSYDRQQDIPKFDKPAIIRGFHYLDEGMARSIGGINHCLKAPAWKVERFCDGVLIRLVPGLFDPENPEHLKIQRQAMKYFKLL